MQIYRNKNPYYRTLIVISAARIALCVLPVFALCFLFWRIGSENYMEAMGFAAMTTGMVIAYAVLSRRYRILLSGHNGERELYKIIKRLRFEGYSAIFTNLPVKFKKNRSEIDMLLVGVRGVVIIEVKNHSGVINGDRSDNFWIQRKKFHEVRTGKHAEKKMLNPLIQLRRQRGIIKALLRESGQEVWVENVLFFSNPYVKLKLTLGVNNHVFSDRSELINFINDMEPKNRLSKAQCSEIIEAIKKMNKT
ncbi:MAG: NERD domain-containing protein [Oscillospiraceae bacterium]|nr:NERD domain-containing protein [Oscillospiraceae bacterium]